MDKRLLELLKTDGIEQRVSSILLTTGYVKIIDSKKPNTYSNLALTDEGFKLLKISNDIDMSFINAFRKKFPVGKKATIQEIQTKLSSFKLDYPDYTDEDILKAVDAYIDTLSSERFCEKAGYFISKRMGNGVVRSTLLEYLEIIKQPEETENNSYGNDLIIN